MRRMRLAQAGLGLKRLHPHRVQQPRHPFAMHRRALAPQPGRHAPHAIIWRLGVLLIQHAPQPEMLWALSLGVVVIGRPWSPQQRALAHDAELRVRGREQAPFDVTRPGQLFFTQSHSTLSGPIC
jgi:hypothetical protein